MHNLVFDSSPLLQKLQEKHDKLKKEWEDLAKLKKISGTPEKFPLCDVLLGKVRILEELLEEL